MDGELIAAIVFIVLVTIFSIINKKKFKIQGLFPFGYIALYRTKLGILLMDKLAKKFPRFWRIFGDIGIAAGFLGMMFITWTLVKYLINLISAPTTTEHVVTLVLPFSIKGMFYVPFSYWIISIIFVASVHELMHGVIGRVHGMNIRSSGFAFLSVLIPLIPAAFVEPDEKQLVKKPVRQQLAMFAAGSFINIVLAFVLLFALFLVSMPVNGLVANDGVIVQSFESISPAKDAGLQINDRIIAIGHDIKQGGQTLISAQNFEVYTISDLSNAISHYEPNSTIDVFVKRDGDSATGIARVTLLPNPSVQNASYLGMAVHGSTELRDDVKQKYGTVFPSVLIWFDKLLYWLYVLSIGIGLMNLAPIIPLDGGRMMHLVMLKLFKKGRHARLASGIVSLILIGVLLLSLVLGYVL